LIERMRKRLAADRASFIEPCLPSPAPQPPAGSNWIHEIKHDGYRLMARRDPVGVRLITRGGHDWAARYPFVVEAVNHLKVRSCMIRPHTVAARAWTGICRRQPAFSCLARSNVQLSSGHDDRSLVLVCVSRHRRVPFPRFGAERP
jgi:hypothetical protein